MQNDRAPRQDEQKATSTRQDAGRDQLGDLPQKPAEHDEQVKGGKINQRADA